MNKIEKLFSESLTDYLEQEKVNIGGRDFEITKEEDWYILQSSEKQSIAISIQAQPREECFSGYIPDFAIYVNGAYYGFVIEIDGYEWHEKSREQSWIDKEKDRAYLKKCFIPIRFAGYEVYHKVDYCITELLKIIVSNMDFFEHKEF